MGVYAATMVFPQDLGNLPRRCEDEEVQSKSILEGSRHWHKKMIMPTRNLDNVEAAGLLCPEGLTLCTFAHSPGLPIDIHLNRTPSRLREKNAYIETTTLKLHLCRKCAERIFQATDRTNRADVHPGSDWLIVQKVCRSHLASYEPDH